MKFIALRSNVRAALALVEGSVGSGITLPILKNVLLKTEGAQVKVVTTNLELAIENSFAAKIASEGVLVVPFETLFSVVQNADAERMTCELDHGVLTITTDNYSAKVQGAGADEFPIIPTIKEPSCVVELEGKLLRESLAAVVGATQFSEIRPEISGVLCDFQVSTLKLVGTDSFRLAEKTLSHRDMKTASTAGCKVIIPLKTVHEAMRVSTPGEATVIAFDQQQVQFTSGRTRLISRLIDGRYPDYEQIVPTASESEATVDREQFLAAVKLVSSFSGKVSDIKLKSRDGSALEIYAATTQVGENTYLLPAKLTGEPISEMSFNWRYLESGLKLIAGKQLTLGINGAAKPAIMRSREDASYFYLVMPIKAT